MHFEEKNTRQTPFCNLLRTDGKEKKTKVKDGLVASFSGDHAVPPTYLALDVIVPTGPAKAPEGPVDEPADVVVCESERPPCT